jgi:hypothetical protein
MHSESLLHVLLFWSQLEVATLLSSLESDWEASRISRSDLLGSIY